MLQRSARRFAAATSTLDLFTQVQIGMAPPLSTSRSFIRTHFARDMIRLDITEAKLQAMDAPKTAVLLKQLFYDKYMAVPFKLFCFDLEFTGLPRFTSDGPAEEIVELALYHPSTGKTMSRLVKPQRVKMNEEAARLTGISDELLAAEGVVWQDAWTEALKFIEDAPLESRNSAAAATVRSGSGPSIMGLEDDEWGQEERQNGEKILLLSHGGKSADVSMIQWECRHSGSLLPDSITFGDSFHIVRDMHRRRPVTADRLPPSWGLEDLANWLKLPIKAGGHRAGPDAVMTWDVLYHTLDRYGDDTLHPKQQLVSRFFDTEARHAIAAAAETASARQRTNFSTYL